MFPRNIRRTDAWKVAQILSLFEAAVREGKSKIEVEKGFIKNLKKANLQTGRAAETRDKNPGDFRTYKTQLSCLGLIFENQTGKIDFTKAGRDILKGVSPLKILQSQVLRHQYPSSYTLSSQVKIEQDIKLRPFVVILKLLLDKRLGGYLTNEESSIPAAVGKTEHNHDEMVEKILELRAGGSFEQIIRLDSLRTIRIEPGDLKKQELMNIGNTFLNVLIGVRFIEKNESQLGPARYVMNPEHIDQVEKACQAIFTPIKNPDLNESFQRSYGAWDGKKDTEKRDETANEKNESALDSQIKAAFFKYQQEHGMQMVGELTDQFVDEAKSHYGFTESQIKSALGTFLEIARSDDEREFIRISQGGASTALAFEKKVNAIFEENFRVRSFHTGQRKRRSGVGGFTDILLIFESPAGCVILDAKSTPEYCLEVDDYRAMKNYCQQFHELAEVTPETTLLAAGFVSFGFSKGVPAKLKKLSEEVNNVPVFALPATELLTWVKEGKNGSSILDSLLKLART
jgi:hypothetical protein